MKGTEKLPRVAYFCMEYGLDPSMRTYAGGLGILAGDYLKGAHDNNYPIAGLGIKWKQGYSDQIIGEDGKPYDTYHNYDYDFLKDTGVRITVKIRNRDVTCKVWLVDKFNNAPLYLLDTDITENEDRWITGQLYGWFKEERISQEMVLGIGGIRALRALGIEVDVYHFNEGHAVFAGFEIIKERIDSGICFQEAVNISKQEIVFTTHTPVIEGNESHYINTLMYLGANNGLTENELISLGGSPFNMTVAALRLSRKSNAVAQLHCETANKMWSNVIDKSEIVGITNAIHVPTWVDPDILKSINNSTELWKTHLKNKKNLIDFISTRTGINLNTGSLLIGFARRAAPYKRSNLIFSEKEVINSLLEKGVIQIVFSGKAHPLDDAGKQIIQDIVSFSKKYPKSVVFLENYDMTIGSMLTKGCDVWLNNPRRPKEASGTSGMKAAMNGVINLSILDGWWPEACMHGINGWQFGDGIENDNDQEADTKDTSSLYKVLLEDVIPTYYNDRNKWVELMRNSITTTKDMFSTDRMLNEYYQKLYIKSESV
jgi:glycogen phosphorylase